jgi:hypothetical protein
MEDGSQILNNRAHGGSSALWLDADGGYADQLIMLHPGNTYRLSAWGELDGQIDLGYVGVTYRDAFNRRLASLEPPMLEFTQTHIRSRR